MNLRKEPTISVIIPTFNSSKTIKRCLESIRKQSYPQDRISIIIVDGGSRDSTLQVVRKYRVRVYLTDPKKQNVEYNKSIGIQKAKTDLLFMIDHDNILPHKNLISKMVKPFQEHNDMVGVETMRYHYSRSETILDRYIALFGVTDPLAYYLGKADRISYIEDKLDSKYNAEDCGTYFIVKFNKDHIPTIGANGFLVNRNILVNNANVTPKKFFPIDVNVDLIRKGYNKYAFIKDSISHISGHGNFIFYLKRRMFFVKQYYLSKNNLSVLKARRYSVYEDKDFWKLVYFIIISATFVVPLIDSVRGYFRVKDIAWFLHPVMCFGFLVLYSYVILEHQVKLLFLKK